MRKVQFVRYEMLVRVREFGEAYRDQFPPASVGGEAFATVAKAVDELSQFAADKMSTAREGRRQKKVARLVLGGKLDAIARTARVIAQKSPGFDDVFRLPRPVSDQVLLTAGRVFIHDGETVAAQFVAHGLPDTFIATLKDSLARFEKAIAVCGTGAREQASAQAGITASLAAGLASVRSLDVLVVNQCQGDVRALAAWTRLHWSIYEFRCRRDQPRFSLRARPRWIP